MIRIKTNKLGVMATPGAVRGSRLPTHGHHWQTHCSKHTRSTQDRRKRLPSRRTRSESRPYLSFVICNLSFCFGSGCVAAELVAAKHPQKMTMTPEV